MKTILVFSMLYACATAFSQSSTPKSFVNPGDLMPDHTFTNIINYPGKSVKISDLKGKWILIDMWTSLCGSCIASFPKMNKISQSFKDKLQVIMVGASGGIPGKASKDDSINKDMYSRLAKRMNLTFTVAFDSVLPLKLDIGGVPFIAVIDPQGVLKATLFRIDSAQISDLIQGKEPDLSKFRAYANSAPRPSQNYNKDIPLLTKGIHANGGIDTNFLFRSLLTEYSDEMPGFNDANLNDLKRGTRSFRDAITSGLLEVFCLDQKNFYHLAFFGQMMWDVWDLWKDSAYHKFHKTIFIEQQDTLVEIDLNNEVRYAYSLKVPKEQNSKDFLMNCMQQDLKKFFGYDARVETRKMPVLNISVADQKKIEKLRTKKSGHHADNSERFRFLINDISLKRFVIIVIAGMNSEVPVFSNLPVDFNIDVDLKVNRTNDDEVTNALIGLGFKIEKSFKEMKVIVLKK